MYRLVEPYRAYLYLPFLKSFNNSLDELLQKFNMGNLDCSEISNYIGNVLDQVHLPDFVMIFDEWLESQEPSTEDRYINFFKEQNGEWRRNLRYNNKYISNLAEHICFSTLKNIELFFNHLYLESKLLLENFGCPELSVKGKLSIAGGDRHNNGQQPIVLKLDDFKIIYKPRTSGTEKILNDICEIIGQCHVCPKTLSLKDHIWQEFIEHKELSSSDNARKVYAKYGNILALADILNINDCHFENFIVDKDDVWFIDSETIFQYYFEDNPDFERSIYQSGLLQSPNVFKTGIGHTSAITAVTNIFKSFTYPHAINDGSEDIKVKYERGFIKNTHNFPHYMGKPITAYKYTEDISKGYVEWFSLLKENKNKVIDYINNNRLIKTRYLIRTTAYYLLVINKIIHPNYSRFMPESLNQIIDKYLLYENANPLFKQLIPYEINCLLNFDIPIFYTSVNSLSLFDGNGKEYHDFFNRPPLSQIKENFERDNKYIIRQEELISRSIHATL